MLFRQISRLLFCVAFIFYGCSGSSIKTTASSLNLEAVESVRIGSAKAPDLDQKFGSPAYVLQAKDGSADIRIYCQNNPCQHESVISHFSKATGLLESIVWVPEKKDAGFDLEGALAHYKNLKFDRKRLQYDYGHYFEYVDTYSNDSNGIVISYDPNRKIVNQIYRGV